MPHRAERRVTAVLGPTNTGKTHLAVERMLGHASGVIGFPLRLLARENYDRAVKQKGARLVALVTGEEKIVPPTARYFVCTVESMPLDRAVAFLAVDEVQLAADPERGHIFTDRLLHARGLEETMLLGADTIRPLIRRLVPEARHETRPRFSTLSYAGPRKLTRLPRRSAIVAFSAADVYALAELIRRQRGGAAVVMGALSPRTRNAQVAMYQAGEVDYLVATDAIGMGLNMDVDHVAFAELIKFDGRRPRHLSAPEIGQIAGRAGRHMSNGSFGTTAEAGPIAPEIVEAVENHRFEALANLYWRNRDLSFRSLGELQRSLEERSPDRALIRMREADDQAALAALAREPEIVRLARGPAAVRLLWEVCQIPDFRKVMTDAHTRLLARIFRHLMEGSGVLPESWVAAQVERLADDQGDIDLLTQRIAHIRTWTYIAHRGDWLGDSQTWQERSRAIEDRLSDALHERLTQRFVDRRAAVLTRRLSEGGTLLAAVNRDDEVLVEGHFVGRIEGFSFVPDAGEAAAARKLVAAARKVVAETLAGRVRTLERDADAAFALAADGRILWHGAAIARLGPGAGVLQPRVEPLPAEFLDGDQRDRVRARLERFLAGRIEAELRSLTRLSREPLRGAARGIAYRLMEGLGGVTRVGADDALAALDRVERRRLARLGVRFGPEHVWIPAALSPGAVRLRAMLWAARHRRPVPDLAKAGRKVMPATPTPDPEFFAAIGYRLAGAHAFRIDIFNALAAAVRLVARQGPFTVTRPLLALAGGRAPLLDALAALGARATPQPDGTSLYALKRSNLRRTRRSPHPADSPFASLGTLWSGR